MNFFEHQDEARRKTGRLVLLFFAAVAAIIVSVYLVFASVVVLGQDRHLREYEGSDAGVRFEEFWIPELFAATVVGVGLVVAVGSFYRIATLGAGGKTIAELLGGRLVASTTTDWRERRLLNVIEEMALASGMPVPPVYVLDDERVVNAFAAGFTPSDAVIGVTRGATNMLTRDELQGVIAHEFSHIFNGDMRLNLRLIGVLHGILLISLIGYGLFRIALEVGSSSRRSSSSSGKKDNSGGIVLVILAVGLALYVLGYIGVFFGHLIKSAVSRQREFLADASAVQFTRNPLGIGGALKKLGALGSRLIAKQAEQASHMYFGNGVKATWLNLTATHPPLVDRIRRIDPTFDGDFSRERLPWPDEAEERSAAAVSASPRPAAERGAATFLSPRPGTPGRVAGGEGMPFAAAAGVSQLATDAALGDVGTPQPQHLDFAVRLLHDLPPALVTDLHEPVGAACVVYALLLHADPAEDEPELRRLATTAAPGVADHVRAALVFVKQLPDLARLPAAQLAMTALRQLTPEQFDEFRRAVTQLIRADRRVSLFEYGVHRLILRRLQNYFAATPPVRVRNKTTASVADAATTLLSSLAHFGRPEGAEAVRRAYAAGRALLTVVAPQPKPADDCGFNALDAALDELVASAGVVKQQVLRACAEVIGHDGVLTIDEAELLRTVADSLDCPMPPLSAPTATN